MEEPQARASPLLRAPRLLQPRDLLVAQLQPRDLRVAIAEDRVATDGDQTFDHQSSRQCRPALPRGSVETLVNAETAIDAGTTEMAVGTVAGDVRTTGLARIAVATRPKARAERRARRAAGTATGRRATGRRGPPKVRRRGRRVERATTRELGSEAGASGANSGFRGRRVGGVFARRRCRHPWTHFASALTSRS